METKSPLYLTEEHEEAEIEFITNQLIHFNLSKAPTAQEPSSETINLILKDQEGQIYGGILGRLYRFALYIHILWISEDLRGQGYGSRLLEEIECNARAKGCRLVHLDTWSFQAPEFYKKHGYEIYGVLEGFPEGEKRYYLKKVI